LERVAREHATAVELAFDRTPSDIDDVDRFVVNMLRHEYTNYDDDQSQEAHRFACEAIKVRCPWLSDECDRQIERRIQAEREEASLLEMAEEWSRAEQERRCERSRASMAQIGALHTGDVVLARVGGRERECTISWVGRSRVDVSYVIKTGEARTRRVYAVDVRPIAATR
jgi:hypothetical protein